MATSEPGVAHAHKPQYHAPSGHIEECTSPQQKEPISPFPNRRGRDEELVSNFENGLDCPLKGWWYRWLYIYKSDIKRGRM